VVKKRQLRRLAGQLFNFLCKFVRLLFQLRVFNLKLLRTFCRKLVQHAGLLFAQLAKLVVRTCAQFFQRFRDRRDFSQRFDVAGVLRLIDGGGQLVIRLQFVRLVGEAVGMIQPLLDTNCAN